LLSFVADCQTSEGLSSLCLMLVLLFWYEVPFPGNKIGFRETLLVSGVGAGLDAGGVGEVEVIDVGEVQQVVRHGKKGVALALVAGLDVLCGYA